MTTNEKFVYDQGKVAALRTALDDESVDSTSLSDIVTGVFGDGTTGKRLHGDVSDATQHVNATLKKLNDGLAKYSQAFQTTGDKATQSDAEIAADSKLLSAGVDSISTPFYENKHGKPDAPAPLFPWGLSRRGPEMI